MSRMKTLIVFGTRPEAIKLAPFILACRNRADAVEPIVCVTGQHREMLQQVTDYFGITPDYDLELMRPNQTLALLTGNCVTHLDEIVQSVQPDCVVAQGDTTTVMASSLVAFYRRTPFVHVEAGLRTGNLLAPWPEELNRRITSLTANLHCAPTSTSAANLIGEGIPQEIVHVTGNTVIDALLWTREREASNDAWQQRYAAFADKPFVLITGHRRENFGGGFENICRAIAELAEKFQDKAFVYPVHLNPNVQEPVHKLLSKFENVHLLPPAPYPEFVWLMDRSCVILTDSGGVQEEAPSLKKPILVMRDTTERPEAVEAGAVALVGTNVERIVQQTSLLLTDETEYEKRQIADNPYGDGCASDRIIDLMLEQSWGS